MLNKVLAAIRQYEMIKPGDTVICGVSGGADSMALLFALYLLREKLGIRLEAAHYNHGLRGEESDADEAFVREFCSRYDIALTVGRGTVKPGKKGLEAAAREARYSFFAQLPGKIATAHNADDNAETVLLHLLRGTGLQGLSGIAPVRGNVIRPMLSVTREQVLAFLEEYHLRFREDSSNREDLFLRNRLRHHVMPLLKKENPSLSENISAMTASLQEDAALLETMAAEQETTQIHALRRLPSAIRSRVLERLLKKWGVPEPERRHIGLVEELVFSEKPSACACLPGGICVGRCYDRLERREEALQLPVTELRLGETVYLEPLSLQISCEPATALCNQPDRFTVAAEGPILLRSRAEGDRIRLSGGSKSLKKLFIDRKIPAYRRQLMPVFADKKGILGVYGIGADLDRLSAAPDAVCITVSKLEK